MAIPAAVLGDMVLELAEMAAAIVACRSASSRTEDDVEVDEADDSFVGELPGVHYVRRRRTRKIATMHAFLTMPRTMITTTFWNQCN